MKKIFCLITIALLVFVLAVSVCADESAVDTEAINYESETIITTEADTATDTATETVAQETIVETPVEPDVPSAIETVPEISKDDLSDIIGIIEESDNRSDVIMAIIEKFGCSQSEAEEILDTFLALGDKYLGTNDAWIGFKKDVQEDTQFWTMVIMCAVAVIFIIGGIFVLLGKTNPTIRRAMFGMNEALSVSKQQLDENSQTLAIMLKTVEESKKKEELYEATIAKKEEHIISLKEKISTIEERNEKERSHMLMAAAYNLRMLKLVCDRTRMPITDKSMIDLWYTKGIESIKDELNAEDIQKIDSMAAMLDAPGGEHEAK